MLRKLRMTCFRQHEDAEFTFGEGLIAVRGPNESGKTTLILAAAYALGGAAVLPLPLSDTVTWGHDEKELKVELTIEIEGRRYVFSRSKAGAECNYDGGKVTGQKEVTGFAAELIGADAKTMAKLMLAKQNSIRGALEEGPGAIAAQIETLANFDLFDRVIEKIQTRLVTGPTKTLDDRIGTLMSALAEPAPEKPDTAALDTEERNHAHGAANLEAERDALVWPRIYELKSQRTSAEQQNAVRDRIARNAANARAKVDSLSAELKLVQEAAARPLQDDRLVMLGQRLAEALDYDRRLAHHKSISGFIGIYPEEFWEGTLDSMLAEMEQLRKAAAEAKDAFHKADKDIGVRQAKLVTSSACGLCGQDVSQFPDVAKKNAELEQAILDLQDAKRTHFAQMREAEETLGQLQALHVSAKPAIDFPAIPGLSEKDSNFVPPRFKWLGEAPSMGVADADAIRAEIARLNKDKVNIEQARSRLPQLQQRLVEEEAALKQALDDLENTPATDVSAVDRELAEREERMAYLQEKIRWHQGELNRVQEARRSLLHGYEAAVGLRSTYEKQLAQTRADLEQLVFNNTLLKKVRAARPLIADKLWNQVLSSVSVMFSQTRQQQSVVTKDKDGFKVNGKPCEGYSGSALDLLGLAIRMALVKTFLPHVSMLILDEVTAACDNDRTTALLGFVAGAGFDQTILVTHEEVSESFADHLIQL